jgi:hypothetical protein
MRYGLNAAIIAGVFCLAPGESARTIGDRGGGYLPDSHEKLPPAGLYFEDDLYFDDLYFDDGKTQRGVKLHPDGRRVARNFGSGPWHCRPYEVTLS